MPGTVAFGGEYGSDPSGVGYATCSLSPSYGLAHPLPPGARRRRKNDRGPLDFHVERAAVTGLVELRGFEPLTFALRTQRSTN